jgi:hypothetical protein
LKIEFAGLNGSERMTSGQLRGLKDEIYSRKRRRNESGNYVDEKL